jgi:hypothetical protein
VITRHEPCRQRHGYDKQSKTIRKAIHASFGRVVAFSDNARCLRVHSRPHHSRHR